MTTLLSIVQKADNPSIPVTFPSSQSSVESRNTKSILRILPQTVSMVFKSVFDLGWSVLKGSLIADDQTPIRSGHKDVGFRPMAISNVSLSLDSIREVKNMLKVSVNDVLVGVILFGIQLYMGAMDRKSSKMLFNTRKIRAYKSAKGMHDPDSEAPWGNRFHFMHVPIPTLSDTSYLNPLEFVFEASRNIKRKRNSLAVPLTGVLLCLLNQIKGPQAAANYVYKTLNNTSLSISHMVGPVEQVALANHPIKGFYSMTVGLSQVGAQISFLLFIIVPVRIRSVLSGEEKLMSITVTITRYMGYIRVGFGVEEGFIDEYQLKSRFEASLEMMLKAAKNVALLKTRL
ncbi:O-acyltransferase WSD1 [Spatholobus suberectus]|nr:O-acyltransferase WSD1 [Spatholobus suberectus]